MISNIIMDSETLRSFGRQIYGHEMWMDCLKKEGDLYSILGLYGHKMVADTPMPPDYANVVLYDDNGLIGKPDKKIIEDPQGWEFTFKDEGADVYTLYIDSNSVWVSNEEGWHRGVKRDFASVQYSGAFNLLAKRIISKDSSDPGKIVHGTLEVMPDRAGLVVGENLKLQVLYEGKPKAGVKMVCYHKGDAEVENLKTDDDGVLVYPIKQKGTYMFIAKFTDVNKKVDDEFDETAFTTVLTMDTL